MFERFTDRARRAMTLANQESQRLGHDHVGTEHLLLGLVKEGSGMAAVVLGEYRVDLGKLRQQVEHLAHPPSRATAGKAIAHSDRYRRVIDFAVEESSNLSNNYVGTEHLLLGLLHLRDGTAAKVLAGLGLQLDDVRQRVIDLHGRSPVSKDGLLQQAMRDMTLHLADEQIDSIAIRKIAEAMINAGWRPLQ
jgi:ATP-dependent Clp protease ATP-binding subunit ClpC